MTYFKKFKDTRGEWRWTLHADNHEAIATSSEGYVEERSCDHSIGLVKRDLRKTVVLTPDAAKAATAA